MRRWWLPDQGSGRGNCQRLVVMKPSPRGLNNGRYSGDVVDVDDLLRRIAIGAEQSGWAPHCLTVPGREDLPWYRREGEEGSPVIYISAGMHGDEPAPLLALLRMLEEDLFPSGIGIVLLPCLNPEGFRRNTREDGDGIDLNREYRTTSANPTVRAHQELLKTLPSFEMALSLHEDWEATGLYMYELNFGDQVSQAREIIQALESVCPVDEHALIDGRPADRGLIIPDIPPENRPVWPESLYLVEQFTRLAYTIESPSDFEMETRVEFHVESMKAFLRRVPLPKHPRD